MPNVPLRPSLEQRLCIARQERGNLQQQIALDEAEIIEVRRALAKAETPYEQRLLEDRVDFLRDRLSTSHAGLVAAHSAYDAARLSGIWASSPGA